MKTFIVLAASVSAQLGDDLPAFDYNSLGDLNFDNFLTNSEVVGNDYADADGGLARRERPRRPGANRPGNNRPSFGGFGNQAATSGFGSQASGFDVGAAGFGEDAGFGEADNEAFNAEVDAEEDGRYFFTQPQQGSLPPVVVATTTPAPLAGGSCWKCDAMNYVDCAATGWYEECGLGEKDCCFVEIREMYGDLKQLCTGCKQTNACENLRKENFQYQDYVELDPGVQWIEDQCRPDYTDQRRNMRDGAQQSVCRQCFQTCHPDEYGSAFCFGSIKEKDPLNPNDAEPVFFHIPFTDNSVNYANVNLGAYRFNIDEKTGLVREGVATAIGIPTHLLLDCHANSDLLACEHIEFTDVDGYFNANTRNIYFPDIQLSNDGKNRHETGDQIRQLHEMTYWGLQGASRHWWENDLKFIQGTYWEFMYTDPRCNINNDGLDTFSTDNCAPFEPAFFLD